MLLAKLLKVLEAKVGAVEQTLAVFEKERKTTTDPLKRAWLRAEQCLCKVRELTWSEALELVRKIASEGPLAWELDPTEDTLHTTNGVMHFAVFQAAPNKRYLSTDGPSETTETEFEDFRSAMLFAYRLRGGRKWDS